METTTRTINALFGRDEALAFLSKLQRQNENIARLNQVSGQVRTQQGNIVRYTKQDLERYTENFDFYDNFPPCYQKGCSSSEEKFIEHMWAYKIPFDIDYEFSYDNAPNGYYKQSGHIVMGDSIDLSDYEWSQAWEQQSHIKEDNRYDYMVKKGICADEQFPINQYNHYCLPIEMDNLPEELQRAGSEYYIDLCTGDVGKMQDFYFIKNA